MTELACYLGLRICEVLGLMWEDFELTTRIFSIRRSAVDGVVADVKSEASRDVIPLSKDFTAFLLRWQQVLAIFRGGMDVSKRRDRPTVSRGKFDAPTSEAAGFKARRFASWLAHFSPHVSQLAGFSGNRGRSSAENDAARRCHDDHECVRKGDDGQQTRSPHQTSRICLRGVEWGCG